MTNTTGPKPSDPSATLLLAARDGDRQAFAALVNRLVRPALSQAIRVLGNREAAEDAVQEAFARLWREAHRYDPDRGGFDPWWRRMLLNCALEARRRFRIVCPIDAAADIADPAPGPEALTERRRLAQEIQAAAEVLPPRQRAALALFYGEDLSMAEIADALGSTEKAVEGLLLRGRQALRAQLEGLREPKT